MDFSSDGFDLEEIDRAFERARKAATASHDTVHNNGLRAESHSVEPHDATHIPDDASAQLIEQLKKQNEELIKSLQTSKGENSILRSNLASTNRQHQAEVRNLINVQTRLKREQLDSIQSLRSEIERLKTERKFLVNEVQDISLQRIKTATTTIGEKRDSSPTTPTTSPRKNRSNKRDLEAGFRDGFDSVLSPKKKKAKEADIVTRDHRAQVAHSLVDDAHEAEASEQPPEDSCSDHMTSRILDFYSLVFNLVVPGASEMALEVLSSDKYFKKEFGGGRLFSVIQQSLYNLSQGAGIESVLVPYCRQCLSLLHQCMQLEYYSPCWLILRFTQIAIEFDPLAVLPVLIDDFAMTLMKLVRHCLELSDFNIDKKRQVPSFDKRVRIDVNQGRLMTAILSSLDLLEVIACCCYHDRTLHRKVWSLISTEFISLVVDHRLPVNIILRGVLMVTPAASHASPIDDAHIIDLVQQRLTGSSPVPGDHLLLSGLEPILAAQYIPSISLETVPLDSLDGFLVLDHKHGDRDWFQYELEDYHERAYIALRRAILRFLVEMVSTRSVSGNTGILAELLPDTLLVNVSRVLSDQLEIIYSSRHELAVRLGLISECVYFIHGVWTLDSNARSLMGTMSVAEYHDYVLALARVAFSRGRSLEESGEANGDADMDGVNYTAIMFPDDIIEKARDVLEQCTTLSEADEIYMGMNGS